MNRQFVLSQILIIPLLLFLYISLFAPNTVYATELPSFPFCSNPQGEIKVSYDSGTHGVVGSQTQYQGKDTVYFVGENNYLQCLCTDQGEGIQTGWLKLGNLSNNEIDELRNEGWQYVPDGTLWGLAGGDYLAKNSPYSCNGEGGNTTPTLTPTPTSSTISSTSGDPGIGGSVIAASAPLLAATGTSTLFYSLLAFGLASFGLGLVLRKKDKIN
ncbi:hypothetical protein A2715_04535 [Candidatus Woesebacteria bacterium RIFCSPHIGHO2_01_FULL_39_32]|uniref:Gram-positive cocci surface proteins LPxTG domain-containing protein n=2 Tax=Candidatus Woeseibacteriota TaxID=1752722 RepID=A0A0G0PQL5_9BACT|nr:MAG: hypothetical protein UT61_C0006G0005 [Candidatus Woesebacteria bacterium GW2011_GWA1_39_8]OGM04888.1 MAG: hypothetical protein A2124_02590 [Candidatus Woesebacteria bacterium GWB1_37_5]OGM25284.1 MAG: hypothetical protein A2715_04535 [Candidatus Woesebacteria bacterium RIFCSPHIGHO2_01_FULL_39_32]OGM37783.1 MAG: hypothetical protein A3F01_01745 [Candidatus Woesebacteria bacterium RIFCSPHIGHO2_12_FULL_38_11]OGM64815.1 MAG: hypothetical protein A2893_04145 [Candidatus Woesebacteria bacteri